ncbi:ABC transporter substrate-binding protein, partial [Escherichia coli]|nr:ABC transporter substrate-binding protein [Escherichia coli]
DPQITGNSSVKDAARNIYEGLVIFDSKGNVEPDLAEKIDISDDKKVYTFQLRKGVKFHNGKEMTADDAEASINRWIKLSSLGKTNFVGAQVKKTGDYTV